MLFSTFTGKVLPGSLYKISWNYGVRDVDIDLDLYKGGSYKNTIVSSGISSMDQQFLWSVPYGLERGDDYTIVMTDISSGDSAIVG